MPQVYIISDDLVLYVCLQLQLELLSRMNTV